MMRKPGEREYREVGSALARFVDESHLSRRKKVAKAIKRRANAHMRNYRQSGGEYHLKKAQQLSRQAERYGSCGDRYLITKCTGCEQDLIGAARCESRICPHCAKKYSRRVREKQTSVAKRLAGNGERRLMFLTLTLKVNPDRDPNEFDVKRLTRCGRKLLNTLYPGREGCGAFSVFEMGENNNLHLHVLVYGFFVPQEVISRLWLRITKDSSIVYIREARSPKKAISYLLKYISKPPEFEDPKKMAVYLDAITGVRRIHTYGIFYNFPICRKAPFGCPFCNCKLRFLRFDGGMRIPMDALFFDEAVKLAKAD